MPIPTSAEWLSLSKRKDLEDIAVARLYYGDPNAGNYISLTDAAKAVVLNGEKFLGVLNKVPGVQQEIIYAKHEFAVSNLVIEVNNLKFQPGKRFSDLLEDTQYQTSAADRGFYNRRIDIRRCIRGKSPSGEPFSISTFENCLPIMQFGEIKDISHTRKETMIQIEDRSSKVDVLVADFLTENDATPGFTLPEASRDKVKPDIHGDHRWPVNGTANNGRPGSEWSGDRSNKLVPMRDLGGGNWLVSHEAVGDLSKAGGSAVWAWDPDLNRFVELVDWTLDNLESGAKISRDGNNFYDYRSATDETASDWDGGDNAIDGDPTTAATIDLTNENIPQTESLHLIFPPEQIESTKIIDADLFIYGNGAWVLGGGSKIHLYVYDSNGPDVSPSTNSIGEYAGSGTGTGEDEYSSTGFFRAALSPVDFDDMFITARTLAGWPGSLETFTIFQTWLRVKYTNTNNLQLFFGGIGGKYPEAPDNWIDDRAQADGYTVTHDENDKSGEPILNFAGVAEDFLRTHLELGDDDIDRDSFNISSALIPSSNGEYLACSEVIEPLLGNAFLFSLMRDCRSYIYWGTDGTIKMSTMEDTYSSATRIIDVRDVVGLSFRRTKLADIRTALNVFYARDPQSGTFTKQTGVLEYTPFQTRYNVTQAQSLWNKETRNILSATTAENIRLFERNMNMQVHGIAEGILGHENLDLEVTERLSFKDLQYLPFGEDISAEYNRNENGGSSQTIYPYFWIYKINRGSVLKFEALQLHRLDAPT